MQPSLCVIVDTEEEFDWSGGFRRENTSVRNIAAVPRVQEVFDEFGIRPTYVVDYPVATRPEGIAPLREIADSGRAEIGAHLHPWVNPPHEEEVNARNSYPGNLPRDLEARKLRELGDAIEAAFEVRPRVYRAGRYGIGPNTGAILEEQGYEVDVSVCPHLDFGADGGPDFLGADCAPYWFGSGRRLLELPRSAAYVGFLRSWAGLLRRLNWWILPGLLSRTGALTRLTLAPEARAPEDMRRLTRDLHRRGHRAFLLDFHSPSADIGHTPYVRSEADLAAFLDRCRRYCEFFLDEMNGRPTTPLELKRELEHAASEAPRGA
ncbi:MAG: polysaccharide deacetylase family protein [Planctomycetota bacterium]